VVLDDAAVSGGQGWLQAMPGEKPYFEQWCAACVLLPPPFTPCCAWQVRCNPLQILPPRCTQQQGLRVCPLQQQLATRGLLVAAGVATQWGLLLPQVHASLSALASAPQRWGHHLAHRPACQRRALEHSPNVRVRCATSPCRRPNSSSSCVSE
jgi:hypothetical protein